MLKLQSIIVCLICLVAGYSKAVNAQADSTALIAQATELLQKNQVQQAYSLLLQDKVEFEGEPEYDYVFGVSARAAGHYAEAIFSLERAVFARPANPNYRFMLALAYADAGNVSAAEIELNKLNQLTLPAPFKQQIAQLQERIRQSLARTGRHWRNWVQLGLGTDSNANNGVDEEFIDIAGLGTVTLFEQNREIDSLYSSFDGQVALLMPQNQNELLLASIALSHSEYDESLAWNRTFVNAGFSYIKKFNPYEFSASIFYRPLWLDDEDYLDYYGAIFGVSTQLTPTSEVGLDLSIAQEDNQQSDTLSKQQQLVSFWWRSPFWVGKQTFIFKYAEENADKDSSQFNERELLGVEYSWRYRADAKWTYDLLASYLKAEYQAVNPLFSELREDDILRLQAQVKYRLNRHWSGLARLHYQDHDSNIALYKFNRQRLWLGVRYEF